MWKPTGNSQWSNPGLALIMVFNFNHLSFHCFFLIMWLIMVFIPLFGVSFFDRALFNYSILSSIIPAYPLTIYFVYGIPPSDWDTCILTYNSVQTAITDINVSYNRKLISIVDVLGR